MINEHGRTLCGVGVLNGADVDDGRRVLCDGDGNSLSYSAPTREKMEE